MLFLTHRPRFPLNQFVELFIYYRGIQHDHALDRFLPNGDTELLIDFGDAPQFIHDNSSLAPIQGCRHVWVSGVRTAPITIPSGSNAEMMVIMFRKGMAYPFFPYPMSEMSDRVFQAEHVWGRAVAEMRERMLETSDIGKRFVLAEEFLLRGARPRLEENSCVHYAVGAVQSSGGRMSVSELNAAIGYSPRHFAAMFRRHVGITPKGYLRIIRFQSVVEEIAAAEVVDWSSMALRCGFYDQSHFINDFTHFAGYTPEEYLARRNEYLNYVPVDSR